ncbi:MAG TPA: amidohydrolase family protein, partial [Acidimicrobiales bacterium]
RRYEIGVPNLMWGNDFPHPEGTWPHTKEWLRNAFHDIPVDETQQILGANAAECYHFDVGALRPLADRFGPTPEELGQTGQDLAKWADLAAAGRSWLTGKEALDLPVG